MAATGIDTTMSLSGHSEDEMGDAILFRRRTFSTGSGYLPIGGHDASAPDSRRLSQSSNADGLAQRSRSETVIDLPPSQAWFTYRVRPSWTSSFSSIAMLLLGFGGILTLLVFGLSHSYFFVTNVWLGTLNVNPDTVLLLLGVINKALDVVFDSDIQNLVSTRNTWLMISGNGIRESDFRLKEEMIKPWQAIFAAWGRWSNKDLWSSRFWLRFLLPLSVSICFVLIGPANNTLGMPKQRWWPDVWEGNKLVTTRSRVLRNKTWNIYHQNALSLIGENDWTQDLASRQAADDILLATNNLPLLSDASGWQSPTPWGATQNTISMHLPPSNGTSYSLTIWMQQLGSIEDELRQTGPRYARASSGMMGSVNVSAPYLTTVCTESQSQIDATSIKLDGIRSTRFDFPYMNENGSIHFTCSVTYESAYVFLSFWHGGATTDNKDHANSPPINPWMPGDISTTRPFSQEDSRITQVMSDQMTHIMPHFNLVNTNVSISTFISQIADKFRRNRNDIDSAASAVASVVGLIFQQVLTSGEWEIDQGEDEVQHLLRFYVYGSGPRLHWQYVMAPVMLGLLMLCTVSLYQMLWYRVAPGEWLEPYHMMFLANGSKPLSQHDAHPSSNKTASSNSFAYFIRARGEAMEVTQDPDYGDQLSRNRQSNYNFPSG